MSASAPDPDYDAVERDLQRRTARLTRYLKGRAVVGLVLLVLGIIGYAGAAVIAGVPLGLWHIEWVAGWTQGFNALLAVFLPTSFGFICTRAGWAWWKNRHPEDPDTGCLVA